jgi:hypothetical protein
LTLKTVGFINNCSHFHYFLFGAEQNWPIGVVIAMGGQAHPMEEPAAQCMNFFKKLKRVFINTSNSLRNMLYSRRLIIMTRRRKVVIEKMEKEINDYIQN